MEEITDEEKKLLILKDKCDLVINKTEKPNSYEFGKAGNRFKIYYSDSEDLQGQLNKLVEAGLAVEGDFKK